jgi:2-polyprenyl-3-methyl-5-hydroxy-6-metoxy-1,4-benzoquinol methylase
MQSVPQLHHLLPLRQTRRDTLPRYGGRLFGAPGTWTLKQCQRSDCGVAWLDPMPTEKDVGKVYRNYSTHENENENTGRAKKPDSSVRRFKYSFTSARRRGYLALKYDTRGGASALDKLAGLLAYLNPALRSALDFSAMYIKVRPGAKLLEIGFGSGRQLDFLRQLGWQVEGLDLDPTAVKVASSRGLAIHLGSLKEQNFPDQSFDAVVSSHVIEHVHDPVGLLAECRRILRPDGKLVIITPISQPGATRGFAVVGKLWTHRVIFTCSTPPHCGALRETQALQYPTSPRPCARQTGYIVQAAISGEPTAMLGQPSLLVR